MVAHPGWRPHEGDRVLVPWGFDLVGGTILKIYGPPGRPTALVAVDLEGPSGETIGDHTVSFAVSDLRPAETGASS